MRLLALFVVCLNLWSAAASKLQRHIAFGPLVEPGGCPPGNLAWQGLQLVLVLGFHLPGPLVSKESVGLKPQDGNPIGEAQGPQPVTHAARPSLHISHRLEGVWGTLSILLALANLPASCVIYGIRPCPWTAKVELYQCLNFLSLGFYLRQHLTSSVILNICVSRQPVWNPAQAGNAAVMILELCSRWSHTWLFKFRLNK